VIDWEELESPKEAPQAPRSEAKTQVDAPPPSAMSASAVAHWRRNLKRFTPGHIGHEYAREALAHLTRFDKSDETEAK